MADSTDLIGQKFGNYRLTRQLGQGSFGGVYLGEHIHLHTPAAVKVLLNTQLAQSERERFFTEARIIEQLDHPHIVRMKDFGLEGNVPYIVMTYAPHGTLLSKCPSGMVLSLPVVVSCVKQIADALQYAHDHNVIHRDVKPANVLLNEKDALLLSDFGIARIVEGTSEPGTRSVGTMAYIAPEQLQGRPVPASDQYALAIMTYEWLTGERPFQGNHAELVGQHIAAPPPPLRQKKPSILPAVEQVVLRALAKNPQQRFPSVQAFAEALERASRGEQSTVLPPSPNYEPTLRASGSGAAMSSPANYAPPMSGPANYTPAASSPANYTPPMSGPVPPYQSTTLANRSSGYVPPTPQPVYVPVPVYTQAYAPPVQVVAKPRKRSPFRTCLVTIVVLFALFGLCVFSASLIQTFRNQASGSSTPAASQRVPSPLAVTSHTLYSANWSKDLGGWKGASDWKWIRSGLIGSDGSTQYSFSNQYTLITAPYHPKSASYVVEAQFQFVRYTAYQGAFGIVVRSNNSGGYMGGVSQSDGAVIATEKNGTPTTIGNGVSMQPDTAYHTYRVEVNSNVITFSIDGKQILQTTDNTYLSAGSVGLLAYEAVIDVHSFQVEKL